jgi:hypothetical protein
VRAHHELGERDVGGSARLQRDGVRAEVLQHVVHVWEPQVLHAALARLAQRHAQVLRPTLLNIFICYFIYYIWIANSLQQTHVENKNNNLKLFLCYHT